MGLSVLAGEGIWEPDPAAQHLAFHNQVNGDPTAQHLAFQNQVNGSANQRRIHPRELMDAHPSPSSSHHLGMAVGSRSTPALLQEQVGAMQPRYGVDSERFR